MVTPHAGVELAAGTQIPGGVVLNYGVTLSSFTLEPGSVLPVTAALAQPLTLPAGAILSAAVLNADGSVALAAGTVLAQPRTLAAGAKLAAGWRITAMTFLATTEWPAGIALPNLPNVPYGSNLLTLARNVILPRGALIPSGANVKLNPGVQYVDLRPVVNDAQGKVWAVAPMLPEGSQSWSMRLVGGADLDGADTRATQYGVKRGNLVLADNHYGMYGFDAPGNFLWTQQGADDIGMPWLAGTVIDEQFIIDNFGYPSAALMCKDVPDYCKAKEPKDYLAAPATARFSVLRTGTGDLDLLAGGDLRMHSLYGVYTAGASSTATQAGDPYNQPRLRGLAGKVTNDPSQGFEPYVNGGAQSVYRAWYPDGGGNLTVRAGANLIGDVMLASPASYGRPVTSSIGYNSDTPGNWLWRQGSGSAAIGQAQPTAWWINFGTYVAGDINQPTDELRGFTGFGTLGGGNLSMDVGGDAGRQQPRLVSDGLRQINPRSQALVLAVGSTGRMQADGRLALTGGGDIELRVGGALNPALPTPYESSGSVTNLRGQTSLQAASFGRLDPLYGVKAARDTRALDLFRAADVVTTGGIALYAGDSAFRLRSLGDLAIEKADDPGRAPMPLSMPYVQANGTPGVYGANTWFSLWTANTAIDLFSAGGNLTPIMPVTPLNDSVVTYRRSCRPWPPTAASTKTPCCWRPAPPAAWTCWRAIRSTAATRRSCAAAHRWTRWPRPTAPPSSAW